MKSYKRLLVHMMDVLSLLIVLLIFPVLFQRYPEFRFRWGLMSAVGMGILIYRQVQKSSRRNITYLLLLFLSDCMAYDMGNWETFTDAFPVLAKFSQLKAVLLICLIVFICSTVLAAVLKYRNLRHGSDPLISASEMIPSGEESTDRWISSETGENHGKGDRWGNRAADECVGIKAEARNQNRIKPVSRSFRKVAGVCLLAGIFIGAIYVCLKNEIFMQELDMASMLTFMKSSVWLLSFLGLATVILISFLYVIWMVKTCFRVIYEEKHISIGSPPFLRLLSFMVILMGEVVFYNTDLKNWLDFVQKPDELAPILKGLFMLTILFVSSHIAYRILYSFFYPDGNIKGMVDHTADLFIKLAVRTLERMLIPAPDMIGKIMENIKGIIPPIIRWMKDYFFDVDETKTGLSKKIWYPFAWGTLFFSIVSFIGTAEGMSKSVFPNRLLSAYLLSFGLQLFVLTFNLHLPKMIKDHKMRQSKPLLLVYSMTVLCSVFFSFTHISRMVYSGTQMQDAQLELRRAYYNTKTQIEKMAEEIHDQRFSELTDIILTVQGELSQKEDYKGTIDFEQMKSQFKDDQMIVSIIDDLGQGSSLNVAKLAKSKEMLENKNTSLKDALALLENDINEEAENIEALNKKIDTLIKERYGVSLGSVAHETYTEEIEHLKEKRTQAEDLKLKKEAEKDAMRTKGTAIETLLSYMNILENQSAGQVSAGFSNMITALSNFSPDIDCIQQEMNGIFHQMADTIGTDRGDEDSYQRMMGQMTAINTDVSILKKVSDARQWCLYRDAEIERLEMLVDSAATAADLEIWTTSWNQLISEAQIYLAEVGVYSQSRSPQYIEALSEELSRLKRVHLMEINQIEKAIRRLAGSNSILAWFSVLLALYLDTVPVLVSFMTADGGRPSSGYSVFYRSAAVGANVMMLFLTVYVAYRIVL